MEQSITIEGIVSRYDWANPHVYIYIEQLTEAGAEAHASYDERTMLPALDCTPYSAPLLMIDPDFKQITIEENVVTIQGGYAPATRTIYFADEMPDKSSRTIQGYSTGRWEGDSLVIDTTRFSDHRIGNGYRGVASGEHKRLVERLTLNEHGTRLIYEFELTDPEYLNETVKGEVEWGYRPDLAFVREECESDNARRFIGE